jgi:hypothetical protein
MKVEIFWRERKFAELINLNNKTRLLNIVMTTVKEWAWVNIEDNAKEGLVFPRQECGAKFAQFMYFHPIRLRHTVP